MRKISIITIGKLRDKNLIPLEKDFLKRINLFQVNVIELKAKSGDKVSEGQEILKKISELEKEGPVYPIALSEWGETFISTDFSNYLFELMDGISGQLLLIIGGADGFDEAVLNKALKKISLSPMTFPHQLARIMLVEQLYRAQSIKALHPYHK